MVKTGAVTELPTLRSERTCAALWFPGGSTCIRLYCIYGGADGTQATHDLTSKWVREALLDAETSGMTPALIAGDLNLEAEQLGCGPTLAVAGWTDIGHGNPTSAASSLRPRRIVFFVGQPAIDAEGGALPHQLGLWYAHPRAADRHSAQRAFALVPGLEACPCLPSPRPEPAHCQHLVGSSCAETPACMQRGCGFWRRQRGLGSPIHAGHSP